MSLASVIDVDFGGAYNPFTVNVLPSIGLKNCMNCE